MNFDSSCFSDSYHISEQYFFLICFSLHKASVWQRQDGCRDGLPHSCFEPEAIFLQEFSGWFHNAIMFTIFLHRACANEHMYEIGGLRARHCLPLQKLMRGRNLHVNTKPQYFIHDVRQVLYLLHDFFLNSSKVGLGSITPFFNKINKVSVSEVSFLSILA